MYLISTEEANELVEKWETGQLEKEEWTHEMHLIMGMAMIVRFGKNALPAMRERILRYNESVGTINSDSSGYHETLTVYWLWIIRNFMLEKNLTTFDEVSIDELVYEEKLAKRNEWLIFYKEETIKSVAARRGFVPPDCGEMVGVDWFL